MTPPRSVLLAVSALTLSLIAAPAAAQKGPPAGSNDHPVYAIDWDQVAGEVQEVEAWAALAGVDVEVRSGEVTGAAYIAAYPENWNGDLVMYAHGYRGEGTDLTVDAPPAYQFLTASGYAWAASSYRRNSYDPGVGVVDTKNLTRHVESVLKQRDDQDLDRTYLTGFSMGGHVTAASVEQYPSLYDGAMPACGVLGDVELFDYFLDYNVGAAAFAGVDPGYQYPSETWISQTVDPSVKPVLSLFDDFALNDALWALDGALFGIDLLFDRGEDFKDFVEIGSGGERVTFDEAWDYWHAPAAALDNGDFFFNIGQGDGTIANRLGLVAQNNDMRYDVEYAPEDGGIDAIVKRLDASTRVRNARGIKPAILIDGDPSVPVLTIHTIGDLFVPIEMEQIYAEEVAANGKSHLLVQRAIRDIGHCSFTAAEIISAYSDLFTWVETGARPAGEVLTGAAISKETLGCAFTTGAGGSGYRSELDPCPPGD